MSSLGTALRLYSDKPVAIKQVIGKIVIKLMTEEGYTAGPQLS